jgi:uncharacterized protein (UPF0332 family)
MVDINWCLKQKSGIKLIEPNENLSREYMKNAEETLSSLKNSNETSNMWKATKKYYAEYLSVYAIMVKIGIKSEIHDCTIELVKYLDEFSIFPKDSYDILTRDKKLRIDNQYYLKNIEINVNYQEILEFLIIIKNKMNSITPKEINLIRNKILLI